MLFTYFIMWPETSTSFHLLNVRKYIWLMRHSKYTSHQPLLLLARYTKSENRKTVRVECVFSGDICFWTCVKKGDYGAFSLYSFFFLYRSVSPHPGMELENFWNYQLIQLNGQVTTGKLVYATLFNCCLAV